MGPFIYHKVPDDMQGDVLYPLNELKDRLPETYAIQVAKYKDREWLLQREILPLSCLWNDVLHFTPVHPRLIYTSLRQAGFKYPSTRFFEFDYTRWDPDGCAIMFFSGGEDRSYHLGRPCDFTNIDMLPSETEAYYRECYSQKANPLLFSGIPHVLYKGSVDIKNCTVIEV